MTYTAEYKTQKIELTHDQIIARVQAFYEIMKNEERDWFTLSAQNPEDKITESRCKVCRDVYDDMMVKYEELFESIIYVG